MDPTFWVGVVHQNTPHTRTALYLAAFAAALICVGWSYLFCALRGCAEHLPSGWLVRTAGFAAPIPIYVILLLVPVDSDLVQVLREDQIVVAIAGLYGLVETIKDIRASSAEAAKNSKHCKT